MVKMLNEILDEMESGVYNFTDNGKCVGCGACCSALLPISRKEVKRIKAYIKKHNIKPHRHNAVFADDVKLDMICPFLDTKKTEKKCDIYEVRPEICREFKCDHKHSEIDRTKALFHKKYDVAYLWAMFKEDFK